MKNFKNKTAAITGAGSGIGRELALELAARGCHLALSDINLKGLRETAKLAKERGVRVSQHKVDVASRDAIYEWAEAALEEHGTVNLVFNNAGVALGSTVSGMSDEDFRWIMDINFWGVVHGTRAFLPHLKLSGDGHVVNISSIFGIAAIPTQSAYNASKYAVRGFTEALRLELDLERAPVSATVVHPGGIKTNIAKSARFGADMKDFLKLDEDKGKAKFERLFTTTARQAALTILDGVRGNKRRVLIGMDARLIDLGVRLAPSLYQPVVRTITRLGAR